MSKTKKTAKDDYLCICCSRVGKENDLCDHAWVYTGDEPMEPPCPRCGEWDREWWRIDRRMKSDLLRVAEGLRGKK